jgi:pilus assembly protein Flp/PilA
MFDCAKIKVDVRSYPSFPSGVPSPVDPETGELKEDFGTFQPPRAAEIAVVQAAVAYPVFVPLLSYNQGKSGHRLLLSSAAFRAESF